MRHLKDVLWVVIILLLSNASAKGQEILFTIERSLNKDQIVYFLNLDEKGFPKNQEPIQLKWLDNEHSGKLIPVNWIKKKFGYGVKILSQNREEVTFKFVSYDKTHFTLKKDFAGNYGVFAQINTRIMKIQHIYLTIDGGSFWKPNITEVAISGFNESAKISVYETLNP